MNTRHHPRAGWPQGALLALLGVLPTMGVMLLVPVLPLLMRDFGHLQGGSYLVPILLTAPAIGIATLSVFAGYLGDRFGHRRILILALLSYGVTGLAPVVLSSFPAIFASRLVLGVWEAMIITLSAALIGDLFQGHDRERWLSLTATFASISAVIFAAASGFLGDAFGWRGAVLVYGLALIFPTALLYLTDRPNSQPTPVADVTPSGEAQFPWRHALHVGLVTLCGSVVFFSLTVQQGMALAALGLDRPSDIGMSAAITSLGVPIGSLLFIPLRRYPIRALLIAEFFLLAISLVGISRATDRWAFVLPALFGLIAAGALLPTLIAWTLDNMPARYLGRGVGVFQSMFACGQFASALVVPFFAKMTGSVLHAFGVLGLFSFAAVGISLIRAGHWGGRRPREGDA